MKSSQWLAYSSLLFLVACTTTPPTDVDVDVRLEELGYHAGQAVTRISNYRLHSWKVVTAKAMILSTTPKHHYLVTFSSSCPELRSATAIAVRSGLRSLTRHDQIIVRSLPGVRRCQIDDLFKVSKIESKD